MYFRYLEYSTLFMVPNIIRVRVARQYVQQGYRMLFYVTVLKSYYALDTKLKRIFEQNPNPCGQQRTKNAAEFEGDGDILGGYCRREEEDCTGAAAKCCNVEHHQQSETSYWRFESENGVRRGLSGPLMRLCVCFQPPVKDELLLSMSFQSLMLTL